MLSKIILTTATLMLVVVTIIPTAFAGNDNISDPPITGPPVTVPPVALPTTLAPVTASPTASPTVSPTASPTTSPIIITPRPTYLKRVQMTSNDDLFNYDVTEDFNYGPADWNKVQCADLTQCVGWPDTWELGNNWEIQENTCKWCPKGASDCDKHHQSPINLERNRALLDHPMNNTCIDLHWMKYEDSSCSWKDLQQNNAFKIDRHALKIEQPVEPYTEEFIPYYITETVYTTGTIFNTTTNSSETIITGAKNVTTLVSVDPNDKFGIGYQLKCENQRGRVWGRLDYSKGFSHWWYLSHIDVKVPSEHTQEGKRYSAEVQLHHFYSFPSGGLADEEKGEYNENEMGTVSVFLEVYENQPPYEHLDRVICEWRKTEDRVRKACGLNPISEPYPACFSPQFLRRSSRNETISRRMTSDMNEKKTVKGRTPGTTKTTRIGNRVLNPHDFRQPDRSEKEWEEWIQNFSSNINTTTQRRQRNRKLVDNTHLSFHNYQFLIDVKTEYYYRYEGTQTVPPCYGKSKGGTRTSTNHWRVMKDPIRVNERQIKELERLLRERISPDTCTEDTAAKVDANTGHVSVARPLMENNRVHFKTFCECENWRSKWPEDRAWCNLQKRDKRYRFYDHPYNFESNGEF